MHVPARVVLALAVPLAATPACAQASLPPGFLDAAAMVNGLVVDMRYAGPDNFVGEKIDGYERPRCLLTVQAASGLAAAQRKLAARGLGLKVFDCYRPQRAVAHFVRWSRQADDAKRKAEFYPDVEKRDLFRTGYIAERSGHSRGSTVDLTVVRRDDGQELDMGTPFDFLSPKAAPSDKSVSPEAQKNRALLAEAMRAGGFRPYAKEWWHFSLANEPFPNTYFDFPVR
jgi:D-alanyl-D-alanine dipeptidase